MYNLNYVYVEVRMDKEDDAIETLEEDISGIPGLYKAIEDEHYIVYKGLLKKRYFELMGMTVACSPYGTGYEIKVDGVPYRDYGYYPWKRVRGLA